MRTTLTLGVSMSSEAVLRVSEYTKEFTDLVETLFKLRLKLMVQNLARFCKLCRERSPTMTMFGNLVGHLVQSQVVCASKKATTLVLCIVMPVFFGVKMP